MRPAKERKTPWKLQLCKVWSWMTFSIILIITRWSESTLFALPIVFVIVTAEFTKERDKKQSKEEDTVWSWKLSRNISFYPWLWFCYSSLVFSDTFNYDFFACTNNCQNDKVRNKTPAISTGHFNGSLNPYNCWSAWDVFVPITLAALEKLLTNWTCQRLRNKLDLPRISGNCNG